MRTAIRTVRLAVCLLAVLTLGLVLPAPAGASQAHPLFSTTRFYTPAPSAGAKAQERELRSSGRRRDEALIRQLTATPEAVWFTGGLAWSAERKAREVVREAGRHGTVATLVLYDIPGRDCSQYSAGGATTDADYRRWVDGVAAGLAGQHRVVVVVEPDGLALLPSDCPGAYLGRDVAALTAGRIADIHYAGRRILAADPEALVYLDAGQSAWQAVGDMARRLDRAGVADFQGFSLNVANYQPTPQLLQYGSWLSKCLYFANNPADGGWRLGRYDDCASQHHPANVHDDSTWRVSEQWYVTNVDDAANPPTSPTQLAHFVIDTSRNGQGAWRPPAGSRYGQTWCNPPGRGLGERPTARTDSPLADAYLWIKTAGHSDGQCNRGVRGSTTDPEWGGIVDPAAGSWFPAQALQLARLARPPLR